MEVSKKVIIAGYFGVGKTSLIRRFVHQKFSDQYITTIGVKIDKKAVEVNGVHVNMILWDIAGEQTAVKIPKSYFTGASGLIYVFDLTREETFSDIENQLFEITKQNPGIETVVLGNKSDLLDDEQMDDIKGDVGVNFKPTSALNGANVEEAFIELANQLL